MAGGTRNSIWLISAAALMILAATIGLLAPMSDNSTNAQADQTPHTIHLDITGTPTLVIPHQYNVTIYQANGAFSLEDFDTVQFVDIVANYSDVGTSNPAGTRSASTLCVFVDAVRCQDRIFVKELSSGDVIEIQGIPLPHRPFTNIQWLNDSLLTVDRWSQPHYGIRYIFDVPGRDVILAVPIFDEVYAGTLSLPLE
jgi:hypothetical protein